MNVPTVAASIVRRSWRLALVGCLVGCGGEIGKDTDPGDDSAGCAGGGVVGGVEVAYDGVDNDCDATTPDDDLDGDGLLVADDCNDTDAGIGGAEVTYDGVDNDCNPTTPDDDLDGDGHLRADDCDDADATVGGAEVPYDGVDNDCDAATLDDDLDGDGLLLAEDCDDADATVGGAEVAYDGIDNDCDPATPDDDIDADGYVLAEDCDDAEPAVNPLATEVCDGVDNDCDGGIDVGLCTLGYGGHRIDKDGRYYYALYNDDGFGVMGTSEWYGSADASSSPEGVTWDETQTVLYYNDLAGNVWAQTEPFGVSSTRVGSFGVGQVGGGVVAGGVYYVGDYTNGDIHAMDVGTGLTSIYATLGSTACKPYFGNSAMSIDTDGAVYAASSCGVVVYRPGVEAVMLNAFVGLLPAMAMDAGQELYGINGSGLIAHFDKSTGSVLGYIMIGVTPSVTWTLAVDGNGDFVVNYWGEQRVFSHVDGSTVMTWDASTYYPGTSTYYWYVTF